MLLKILFTVIHAEAYAFTIFLWFYIASISLVSVRTTAADLNNISVSGDFTSVADGSYFDSVYTYTDFLVLLILIFPPC